MHEPSLRELTATYYGGAEEAASLSYRRYREKVKGWDRPEGGLAVGDRVRFTRMYTHGPSRVFAGDSAVVVRGGDGGEDVDVCLADGTTVPLPSGYAEFAGKSAEKEESVQLTVRAESASGLAGDHDSKLLLSCGAGVWATGTRASRSPRWNEAFTTALPIDGLPATIRCEAHADGGCVGVGTAVVTATAAEGLPVVMRLRPPPDRSLPLTTSTGGCGRVHLRAVAQRRTAKQLCDSGAAEVLGGVRRGAVRAADWVGSAVGRMRCYDAGLRFVSEARGEMAAAVAEGRDAALLRGGARALEGLPFGVSDRIDVGCVRTRVGAADHVPGRSAAVVRAATAAGAVFVAKLRSNPLQRTAAGVSPAAAAAGCPRLPHDPTLPAGNGCSGCAVAVSCGAVACAFGVDAFGGCRLPSALCGVACLKPAADRYGGAAGVVESVPAAEAVCLMARTVRDVAAIDSALAATPEASPPLAPPRFGVAPHRPAALSQQAAGVWQSVCSALARAGAVMTPVDISAALDSTPTHRPAPAPAAPALAAWCGPGGEGVAGAAFDSVGDAEEAVAEQRRGGGVAAAAVWVGAARVWAHGYTGGEALHVEEWRRVHAARATRARAARRAADAAAAADRACSVAQQSFAAAMSAAGADVLLSPAVSALPSERAGGVDSLGAAAAELAGMRLPSLVVPAALCPSTLLPFSVLLEGSVEAVLSAGLWCAAALPGVPAPPPPPAEQPRPVCAARPHPLPPVTPSPRALQPAPPKQPAYPPPPPPRLRPPRPR
eukprot:TRINITY_DN21736_c0_g1_i1.p1 TRINITY_DN21736_c0_g1~~TRINITY_DN21736_c0_g1_i1.p1  ORF type:complete len:792 (+),score=336.85 TRINITY_DN21736_c0_g1_i1:60-2378(+)